MVRLLKGFFRGKFKGELKQGVWCKGACVWVLEVNIWKFWYNGGNYFCNGMQTGFWGIGESSSIISSILKILGGIFSSPRPKNTCCGWDKGR